MAYELKVLNCSADSSLTDGIKLIQVIDFLIEGGSYTNNEQDGIKANVYPVKGRIENVTFENNGDDEFDSYGGGADILLKSCTFRGRIINLKNEQGVKHHQYVNNFVVDDCDFYGCRVSSITRWDGVDYFGINVVIKNSRFHDMEKNAFSTNGAVNFQFLNNIVLLKGRQTAIALRPPKGTSIVKGNLFSSDITTIDTDSQKGVYLIDINPQSGANYGTEDPNSLLIIEDNLLIGGRRDIDLSGATNVKVINNTGQGQNDLTNYLRLKQGDRKFTNSKGYLIEYIGNK